MNGSSRPSLGVRRPELPGRHPLAMAILLIGLLVTSLAATPRAEAVINPGSMAGTVTNGGSFDARIARLVGTLAPRAVYQ